MRQMNGTASIKLGSSGRTISLQALGMFLSKMSSEEPRTVSSDMSLELEYSLQHKLVRLIYRDVTTRYLRGDEQFHGGEIVKIVDLFKLTPVGKEFLVSRAEKKPSGGQTETKLNG